MSVNRAVLIGNLTQDPELRRIGSGKGVCNFTLATTEKWMRDGEKKESTEYHRCVAWGKDAEHIAEWCRKGEKLYVEGKLQTRKWEKDGVERYTTEVVVRWWEIMSKTQTPGAASPKPRSERPAAPSSEREEVQDDDLPF